MFSRTYLGGLRSSCSRSSLVETSHIEGVEEDPESVPVISQSHIYVTYFIWLGTFWSPKEKSVTVITQSYDHMPKYVRECANLKVQIENPTLKTSILEKCGVLCAHHCVNRLLVGGNP